MKTVRQGLNRNQCKARENVQRVIGRRGNFRALLRSYLFMQLETGARNRTLNAVESAGKVTCHKTGIVCAFCMIFRLSYPALYQRLWPVYILEFKKKLSGSSEAVKLRTRLLNCIAKLIACDFFIHWLNFFVTCCCLITVVRGYIHPMFPVENGLYEQANIVATEVIRQQSTIFVKRSEMNDEFTASVKVPNGCHWKQMEKRLFLLTGNLEDGKGPVIQCHIKEQIWVKLKKENIQHLCRVVHF